MKTIASVLAAVVLVILAAFLLGAMAFPKKRSPSNRSSATEAMAEPPFASAAPFRDEADPTGLIGFPSEPTLAAGESPAQHVLGVEQAVILKETAARSISAVLNCTNLIRPNDLIGAVSAMTNFFYSSQSALQDPVVHSLSHGRMHRVLRTNTQSGENLIGTLSGDNMWFVDVQTHSTLDNKLIEMLKFGQEGRVRGYLSAQFGTYIGFYTNGLPEYFSKEVSTEAIYSVYFTPDGQILHQKMRSAEAARTRRSFWWEQ